MAYLRITDQCGREVEINAFPARVVSLVPSLTDLLCGLGLKDRLVGVTKFCDHPEGIKHSATVVGGTKQIRAARIRELAPDLVLCNKEENTLEIVGELSSFTAVHVSDIVTLEDFYELLQQYAVLFQVEEKARALQNTLVAEVKSLEVLNREAPKSVAYFIWKDPWMLAGGKTFIDHMLCLGGFRNVVGKIPRYPSFSGGWPEEWGIPEVVLLSSEPYPFGKKHIEELKTLLPDARVVLVDGTWFSWYGARLPEAIRSISTLRKSLS